MNCLQYRVEFDKVFHHNFFIKNNDVSIEGEAAIVPYIDKGFCCVYDFEGRLIESSGETDDKDYQYIEQIEVPGTYVDKDVVFIGRIIGNWGLFFIDSLSRLWYVLDNPTEYLLAYCGDGYEQNTLGFHSDYAFSLLGLLGISKDQLIDVRQPTRFKSVIVPSKSFRHIEVPTYGKKSPFAYTQYCTDDNSKYYYTKGFAEIYKKITDNCNLQLPTYDKIYFSRTRLKRRKEVGEKSLERIFEANEFKVLYPEQLNPTEQIWYVKNAKILASVEGTLAHNSVFARPGLTQIILRKQSEIIPRQFIINQAVGIETIWVDSYYEPFPCIPISHSKGPFLLRANKNVKQMCQDLGCKYIKPSCFSIFSDYSIYCYKSIKYSIEKLVKKIIKS